MGATDVSNIQQMAHPWVSWPIRWLVAGVTSKPMKSRPEYRFIPNFKDPLPQIQIVSFAMEPQCSTAITYPFKKHVKYFLKYSLKLASIISFC